MEAAAIILPMVAGGIGAVGTIYEGNVAQQNANFEAKQLKEQANREVGLAGERAAKVARDAKLANSRNLAVAAASGAGAADPTVLKIMGDVEAQGVHNSLTEMYKGFSRKADLLTEANVRKIGGANAKTGSFIGAAGTLLDGVSTGLGRLPKLK